MPVPVDLTAYAGNVVNIQQVVASTGGSSDFTQGRLTDRPTEPDQGAT